MEQSKEARKKLPKNRGEMDKTSAKGARTKLPAKKWVMLIFEVIFLLITTGAVIIASQLFVGNIMLAMLGAQTFSQPMPMAVYSALSYIVAILIIVVLPHLYQKKFKADKKGIKEKKLTEIFGIHGWPTWTDIGLAPIAYVVYLLGASGLMALFSLLPWFNAGEAQNVGFSVTLAGWDRVVAFVTLVVVAPIAEELIFRGWLYGKLRKDFNKKMPKWLNITLSIFLVSLLFGIVHLQWNVGVNVFALSVVLCLLRELTGTTYSGILLHMIKNGLAFYLLYVLGV